MVPYVKTDNLWNYIIHLIQYICIFDEQLRGVAAEIMEIGVQISKHAMLTDLSL